MARALLREDQIRDVDNLSEAEHDVLVHENLVVSGTLNLTGTQGDIDLTTDGTNLLVDGTAISGGSGGGGGAETFLELTDTPSTYSSSAGKLLSSTGSGIEFSQPASGEDQVQYFKLSDVKSAGTYGGTFTAGSWQTRTLNTKEYDDDNLCSLSSNQFTLAAGTYRCDIACPAYAVDFNKARLYNTTAASTILVGSSEFENDAQYHTGHSNVVGQFTIASGQALEVQHRCNVTQPTSGFGAAFDLGEDEVFTTAEFWKVGVTASGSEDGDGEAGWTYTNQVATTSGTTVELTTSIPASTLEIEVMLNGVKTTTSGQVPIMQFGDAGGYETTGYVDHIKTDSTGVYENGEVFFNFDGNQSNSDGFYTSYEAENNAMTGFWRITRWDSSEDLWFVSSHVGDGNEVYGVMSGGGNKTMSEALTSIRLTTTGGSATFNAGKARIRYK